MYAYDLPLECWLLASWSRVAATMTATTRHPSGGSTARLASIPTAAAQAMVKATADGDVTV